MANTSDVSEDSGFKGWILCLRDYPRLHLVCWGVLISTTWFLAFAFYDGRVATLEAHIELLREANAALRSTLSDPGKRRDLSAPSDDQSVSANIQNAIGDYEWQWAGEKWYGRVILTDDLMVKDACVHKIGKPYRTAKEYRFQVAADPEMKLGLGAFTPLGDGRIHITMNVDKQTHGKEGFVPHRISGDLKSRRAFAGTVIYRNLETQDEYSGDMVLVEYRTSSLQYDFHATGTIH